MSQGDTDATDEYELTPKLIEMGERWRARKRKRLSNVLSKEILRQLGRTGMDGGSSIGVDSNAGYDGEAVIYCDQLADAVQAALDGAM